jgi:hypothetical protein
MPAQPRFGDSLLQFECGDNIEVLEASGAPSNLVISNAATFRLGMYFELKGPMAAPLVAIPLQYTVSYFAESIGAGADETLATIGPKTTSPNKLRYEESDTGATIGPGTLRPGVYRLGGVASFGSFPIAGFAEGPVIQVFQDDITVPDQSEERELAETQPSRTTARLGVPVSETEQRILGILDDRVGLDKVQVASAALVRPSETERALNRLMEVGLIRDITGPHGRSVYVLTRAE